MDIGLFSGVKDGDSNDGYMMTTASKTHIESSASASGSGEATDVGAVVLFDGVCNLCNGWVNFVIDRDPAVRIKFAALQSDPGKLLLAKHKIADSYLDSIVLIEGGAAYFKSTAVLRASRHLRFPWRVLKVFLIVPRPLRDLVYRGIAKRRYRWFGKREACRVPTPELQAHFLS